MRIDRFLLKSRILDLKSRELPVALDELLAVALPAGTPPEQRGLLRNSLIERETQMQRRVGDWAALPSIRTPLVQSTVIAVGRLPKPAVPAVSVSAGTPPSSPAPAGESAPKESVPAAQPAPAVPPAPAGPTGPSTLRVIFLVLAPEHGRSYHAVLSELVHELEDENCTQIETAPDLKTFRRVVTQIFKGAAKTADRLGTRWNRRFAKTAARLAETTRCQVLLFFADTFSAPVPLEEQKSKAFRTIIVSGSKTDYEFPSGAKPEVINVSSFAAHRMSQLRAALFVGLMRGSIRPSDRVCCLGGSDGSDKLDSLLVIEVAQEFPSMMVTRANTLVPAHVRPEVLERAIGIATDLAAEGREGKPVGTIMVLGEAEKIMPYVEQLVLNPFSGYRTEDRNILNPFIEETIKEWALIDGAFVIDGNGKVHSAGSRLTAVDSQLSLQSGLGTRHAAAAAISSVADCAAVCVSSSGQVTLFRHGEAIVLLERSVSRTF